MKARREVKVALDKKDKALERKARNKVHKFKKKLENDNEKSEDGRRHDEKRCCYEKRWKDPSTIKKVRHG